MVPATSASSVSSAPAAAPPAGLSRHPSYTEQPAPATVILVGPTTYEVRQRDEVVGFIDIVGGVYVALAGPRYDHAVEVRQSIVLDAAIAALV